LSARAAPALANSIIATVTVATNTLARFFIPSHLLSFSPKTKPEATGKTGPPLL